MDKSILRSDKVKLITERLVLVPLGLNYLHSTHEYASDIENTKLMIYLPNTSLRETEEFLEKAQAEWQKENPDFYEFAILLENEHIGAIGIDLDRERHTGELGWIINKRYWGNGYATEAAREVMNFAIRELKLKKIIAHCDSENISSYKVMQKLGLSLVSITKGRKNKSSYEEREEMLYSLDIE
jgi:RimJ/RimL family protein N-acetyltransferase